MAGYAIWHQCRHWFSIAPLHGASKMIVSARVSNELSAEIDRVAAAQGQSRAAWVATVIARAVLLPENDHLPIAAAGEGHASDLVRVTVRLSRSEIEAIDRVGAPMGLSRNEWIKRALRWQLWDKAARLRLAPATSLELGRLRKQVLAIGRNINQAVHAMNAANQPDSTLDLGRIAEPFLETCAELRALLVATRRSLASHIGGEVAYWTGAYAEARR
nr:hypothetical protein [Sphingomonas aliaeris]